MNPLLALVDWLKYTITAPKKLREWESFYQDFSSMSYHTSGMGCGLEDRGITDRYEAMQHGWEQAVEQIAEIMPEDK